MRKNVAPIAIRNRFVFCVDLVIILISHLLVLMLITDYPELLGRYIYNIRLVVVECVVFEVILYLSRTYRTFWSYANARDYLRLAVSLAASAVITLCFHYFLRRNVRFLLCFLSVNLAAAGIFLIRVAIRGLNRLHKSYHSTNDLQKRTLIVGAGDTASILIKGIQNNNDKMNYKIIGLADDDKFKKNRIVSGCRVLGNVFDIPKIVQKYEVEEIIIAIPSLSAQRKKEILNICAETECLVKTCAGLESLVDGEFSTDRIKNVEIEDLLGREPVVLNNDEISGYINGKVIFVTGGGGSIGSELCRQIMKFNPAKLVIIDIYENNAYDLQMELNRIYPDNPPEVLIASVRDMDRLETVFNQYRPYIVFHAAAHKHVPLMEHSPGEAIKNNVFGTYNVAKCADKYGVRRFVMISTDKAVNPTNVMGATKRICEMIVQCMQTVSKTEFVAVRFGNVLGSNGSVIPLFKKQIETGGPVTVTHKEITRYFMTIPEAACLVLQAASYANGGEIFVLDMGQSVKIYDLAVNLIKLSGLRPGKDIQIEFTGLRPGEKLYEELLTSEEGLQQTKHDKIFIGQPIVSDMVKLDKELELLQAAVESDDNENIKDAVAQVVPTYVRNNQQQTVIA